MQLLDSQHNNVQKPIITRAASLETTADPCKSLSWCGKYSKLTRGHLAMTTNLTSSESYIRDIRVPRSPLSPAPCLPQTAHPLKKSKTSISPFLWKNQHN